MKMHLYFALTNEHQIQRKYRAIRVDVARWLATLSRFVNGRFHRFDTYCSTHFNTRTEFQRSSLYLLEKHWSDFKYRRVKIYSTIKRTGFRLGSPCGPYS